MKEELLKGLTEEQIKTLNNCKSKEEFLAFAKEEGLELTEDELEAFSGGFGRNKLKKCPNCGSENLESHGVWHSPIGLLETVQCLDCKTTYRTKLDGTVVLQR